MMMANCLLFVFFCVWSHVMALASFFRHFWNSMCAMMNACGCNSPNKQKLYALGASLRFAHSRTCCLVAGSQWAIILRIGHHDVFTQLNVTICIASFALLHSFMPAFRLFGFYDFNNFDSVVYA